MSSYTPLSLCLPSSTFVRVVCSYQASKEDTDSLGSHTPRIRSKARIPTWDSSPCVQGVGMDPSFFILI